VGPYFHAGINTANRAQGIYERMKTFTSKKSKIKGVSKLFSVLSEISTQRVGLERALLGEDWQPMYMAMI